MDSPIEWGVLYYEKYVPWKRELDKQVGILRDNGFMLKFKNDPIALEARIKWRKAQPPLQALQLKHFYLPSIVQFAGWLLALLSFGLEMLSKCLRKHKQNI